MTHSTRQHRAPGTAPQHAGASILKAICLALLLGLGAACQQDNKERAFDGKSNVKVVYYSNSTTVQSRFETKDGIRHGLFHSYYPSGRVKSKAHYKDGIRVGQVTHFHEDGRMQGIDHYEDLGGGRSVRTTFFDSSQVVKVRVHLANGIADGLTQMYYPNGKLKSETLYQDGFREGLSKQYYEDGKVRSLAFYKADRQDSLFRSYYPNGQLNIQSTYYAGRLHGPYAIYRADGKLQKQLTYQNGQPGK